MAPGLSKGLRRGSSNISTPISGGTSTDDGVGINLSKVQVSRLDASYPGGLVSYIKNVRKLLADSKAGNYH